jgi:hypothetical protein
MTESEKLDKLIWRMQLEEDYVVLCRHCYRKIFEPKKTQNQLYYKDKCPHCGNIGKK